MLWQLLRITYLLVWLFLLVHCLKRKRFFPMLGGGWSTKVLWLVTFLFFNPVLTLLYVIFGVALKPPVSNKMFRLRRVGSSVAIVLIAVVLVFFEMPAIGSEDGPVTISDVDSGSSGERKSGLNFEVTVGTVKSENNYTTTSNSSNSGNDRFSSGTAVIRCESEHPLLDRVARIVLKELASRPYIHEITYYPAGETLPMNQRLPDIFISLGLEAIKESKLFVGRQLDATITCKAGTSLIDGHSHSSYPNSPPRIHFGIESTLQHKSKFSGIESRQGRYKQQAENIAGQISEGLTNQFDKWVDKHGLTPELPEFLYGRDMGSPEFPFISGESAHKIMSGNGLFVNNHSTWMFKDDRVTLDVLKECRAQLRELGYSGGRRLDKEAKYPIENMTMEKGNEHVTIFRQRRSRYDARRMVMEDKPEDDKPMPMVVQYESLFTGEQMAEAMDKLLGAETGIETLLLFQEHFDSDEQKRRLFSILEKQRFTSMAGCLALARLYKGNDETEKAKESLMLARAMAWSEKQHHPRASEIAQLAKDLEDESLAKKDVELADFTKAGFVDLTAADEPVSIEVGLDEPAKLLIVGSDGRIKTVALIISRSPRSGQPVDSSPLYEMLKIVKTSNSSSVVTSDTLLSGVSVYVPGYSIFQVTVDAVENERFKITAPDARKLKVRE